MMRYTYADASPRVQQVLNSAMPFYSVLYIYEIDVCDVCVYRICVWAKLVPSIWKRKQNSIQFCQFNWVFRFKLLHLNLRFWLKCEGKEHSVLVSFPRLDLTSVLTLADSKEVNRTIPSNCIKVKSSVLCWSNPDQSQFFWKTTKAILINYLARNARRTAFNELVFPKMCYYTRLRRNTSLC